MATSIPAEIDLFTVPHSRMKELVNTYTQKVQCVDFRDCQETFNLLKELQSTLYEFKSHECIENLFIMDQLRNRLKQRHIYNYAVCNCHNDNRISKMLKLVKDGKHLTERSVGERLSFGEELQKCFTEFVQQFLPHMEEEENIFQPLMVEHFEYEELRVMKEVVLEQHELIKDPQYQEKAELDLPEVDEAIKELRDIDQEHWFLADLFREETIEENITGLYDVSFYPDQLQISETCHPLNDITTHNYLCLMSDDESLSNISNENVQPSWLLPSEILLKIFHLLTPPDRGRCAQVCSLWNEVIYSSILWQEIYPIQWARGIWSWDDAHLNYAIEDEILMGEEGNYAIKENCKYDEDADVDESEENNHDSLAHKEYSVFAGIISYLLPKIGMSVHKLILDAGRSITSRQIRQALILCPNMTYLSAAYTSFDYHTLKGVFAQRCLKKLKYLDLQGCINVDDHCLYLIAECLGSKSQQHCARICSETSHLQKSYILSNICGYCVIPPPSITSGLYYSTNDALNCCINGRPSNETGSNSLSATDSSETDGELDIEELHSIRKRRSSNNLEYLNFSGCYKVTEQGLFYLLNQRLLQHLSYLNVSSCFNISGIGLHTIVQHCQNLKPENLYYCNGIINGPYPTLANGCENMYHPIKVCCQTRLDL